MSTASEKDDISKRGPLDNMSREELLKKCKGLLSIAQKAKLAKDEFAEQNKNLKQEILKYETQNANEKDNLIEMKKIVDTLTLQALNDSIKIENYEKKLYDLDKQNKNVDQDSNKEISSYNNVEYKNRTILGDILKLFSQINVLTMKLDELNKFGIEQNSVLEMTQNTDEMKLLETTLKESASKIEEIININALLNLHLSELVNVKSDLIGEVGSLKELLVNDNSTINTTNYKEKTNETIQNLEININDYKNLIDLENEELTNMKHEFKESDEIFRSKILNLEQSKLLLTNEINDVKELLKEKIIEIDTQKNNLQMIEIKLLEFDNTKQSNIIITKLYEDVKMSLENLTKDYNDMKINYDKLKDIGSDRKKNKKQEDNDIAILKQKIKLYRSKLSEISIKLVQIKSLKCILLETIKEYSETIPKWQEKISVVSQQICTKLEQSDNENKKLKEALNDYDNINNENSYLKQLVEEKNLTINNLRKYEQKFQLVSTEYEKVLINLEFMKCEIDSLNEIIKTNEKAFNKGNDLKVDDNFSNIGDNEGESDAHNDKVLIDNLTEELEVVKTKHTNLVSENSNFLLEIKELSDILKERGEIISKQQSKINELKQKLDDLNNIYSKSKTVEIKNDYLQNVASVKCQMDTKDTEIIDVNKNKVNEMPQLHLLAEDTTQMHEVEENFEEKYNKLRIYAIKLKKKISEQAALLNNQTSDTKSVSSVCESEIISKSINNLHKLQQENDKLQDEIDLLKKKSNADVNLIKELNNKLEKTVNIPIKINEYDNKHLISELKKELEVINLKNRELENGLFAKEKENNKLIDVEKGLQNELEKIKNFGKQTNVMTLEMEAYEKSLNDINLKLESTNVHNKELRDTIKIKDSTMDTLKYQIGILEENLKSEKEHSYVLKQQIDLQLNKLKESDHAKTLITKKINNLITDIESLKLELCDYKLQFTKNVIEKNKFYDQLKIKYDKLLRHVIELEEKINAMELLLAEKNNELINSKTEFYNYKIRAQSVLRQNQTKDTIDNDLEEEILVLRSNIDKLNQRLNEYSDKLLIKTNECNEIKTDRERLQQNQNELNKLLNESHERNEKLISDINKQNYDNQEALKTQQLYTETLINYYKNQIHEIEEKYSKEIENINSKYIDKERSTDAKHNDNAVSAGSSKDQIISEQKINLLLMVREDGEGSESTNPELLNPIRKTSTMKMQRELVPLDELLNTSMEDEASDDIDSTVLLETTKEKLTVQNNRVKHLTSLLAETEQDLAKLTQLNDVLKEEVRRQQRSLDREKHIQNSEYLKNVLIKFVSLNSCDEKQQLIPVLNTILKLSPEETQKLQVIAKGGDNFKKGWGSYLPMWSNNET